MEKDDTVVVMDFSSPLAFLMNARPAKGYWITFDDGRTISEKVHPEPGQIFADADHVMLPKLYVEPDTAIRLGPASVLTGFVRLPGVGPRLTCRMLQPDPAPKLPEWSLTLGDVVLF